MLQDHTVKAEEELSRLAQPQAALHAGLLLEAIGQQPPIYGHVEITYLAGKLTKVEKRESFKP